MVIDLPFHLNIQLQYRDYFSIFQNTLHILTLFINYINSCNYYPKYTISPLSDTPIRHSKPNHFSWRSSRNPIENPTPNPIGKTTPQSNRKPNQQSNRKTQPPIQSEKQPAWQLMSCGAALRW